MFTYLSITITESCPDQFIDNGHFYFLLLLLFFASQKPSTYPEVKTFVFMCNQ